MPPEETKQAPAVMIASETKNIQERYRHGKSDEGWVDCPEPDWDWDSFEYRIAPEPIEVEVLYHPATGDFMRSDRLTLEHARQLGWTFRRATIHPETK